jgi:uncharacterized protein DUF885
MWPDRIKHPPKGAARASTHDQEAGLGRLANEALRACRLVIDTGLHDLGWTRAESISYMAQHSLYAGEFVVSEIERYVAGPGQALAYKVGELELLRLRTAVQARDGAAFSLRSFHEVVLAEGSLPLAILGERLLGPGSAQRARLADLQDRVAPRWLARGAARVALPADSSIVQRLPAARPNGDDLCSPVRPMPSPLLAIRSCNPR